MAATIDLQIRDVYPAQVIHPLKGRLVWVLDRPASQLPDPTPSEEEQRA